MIRPGTVSRPLLCSEPAVIKHHDISPALQSLSALLASMLLDAL